MCYQQGPCIQLFCIPYALYYFYVKAFKALIAIIAFFFLLLIIEGDRSLAAKSTQEAAEKRYWTYVAP